MGWLRDHAPQIEALSAAVTALVAVAALIGVKLQIDAAERLQLVQGARDIYRESLVLAVQNPDLAAPDDACAVLASARGAAYVAYVDHLLYTAEQVTDMDPTWAPVFDELLAPHAPYLCAATPEPMGYTEPVAALLAAQRVNLCPQVTACAE